MRRAEQASIADPVGEDGPDHFCFDALDRLPPAVPRGAALTTNDAKAGHRRRQFLDDLRGLRTLPRGFES